MAPGGEVAGGDLLTAGSTGGAERGGTRDPSKAAYRETQAPSRAAWTEALRAGGAEGPTDLPSSSPRLSQHQPVGLDGAGAERSWVGKFQTELVNTFCS